MNATEAKELALENQGENGDKMWDMLKNVIFSKIKSATELGKFKVEIDLNSVEMLGANQNMSLIADNLAREGYKAHFSLTRTLNGARSVIIEW